MTNKPTLDPRIHPVRPDLAARRYLGMVNADQFVDGKLWQVDVPNTPIVNNPSHDAMMTSELLYGEIFEVFEEHEGWAWGQAQNDSYVGYISSGDLVAPSLTPTHVVSTPSTHLYPRPDLKSRPVRHLYSGASVSSKGAPAVNGFVELSDNCWIYDKHIVRAGQNVPDYVSTALSFLGSPYLWGGKTHAGMDCSGLVQIALNLAGLYLPRDTDMQFEALTSFKLPPDDGLQRGDIAFFPGHVGIMVDAQRMLHANATHMAVTIDPLSDVIDIVGRTEKFPYSGACRPAIAAKAS